MLFDDGEKLLGKLLNEPLAEAREAKDRLLQASQHDPTLRRLFDLRHAEMRRGNPMTDSDFFAMVALTMMRGQRNAQKVLVNHMNTCLLHKPIILNSGVS